MMALQKYMLIVIAVFTLSNAFADSTPLNKSTNKKDCGSDINEIHEVFKQFEFRSTDPKIIGKKFNPCDDKIDSRLFEALIFLRNNGNLPSLTMAKEQNILGANAWTFFRNRIHKIIFTKDGEGLCGKSTDDSGAAAFVSSDDPHTMHICGFATWLTTDLIARNLVHEARHAEGFPHVICDRGFFKHYQVAACDESFDSQGSYAVGVEFNLRLSKIENLDPILREDSRVSAFRDIYERFNKVPFDIQEVPLLQDTRGSIYRFNGDTLKKMVEGNSKQILVNRARAPLIFDTEKGTAKSFLINSTQTQDASGVMAEYFRNNLEPSLRDTLVDVLYAENYSCYLFLNSLMCRDINDVSKENFISIRLALIRPVSFLYRESSAAGKSSVHIVDEDGFIYSLPLTFVALSNSRESDFIRSNKPLNFLKVAKLSGDSDSELVLSRDGEISTTVDGVVKALPQLINFKFKSVASPILWSDKLENL